MNKPELKLDWCSYQAAKYAVEHWHYSKSMPMPPLVRIGVWESGKFIGCVLFSRGASPHLGNAYRLNVTEVCELTGVALSSHNTPVSRILSIAIKLVRGKEKGLRLIVSFSDSNEGHHGGIYQAAGWVYCGTTSQKFDYIAPDGKRYRDRQVTRSGVARQFGKETFVYKTDDCTPIPMRPKHRYLYPLDPAMRAQIAPLAKPYPKRTPRGTGETDNAPQTNAETEGASPIVPLSE